MQDYRYQTEYEIIFKQKSKKVAEVTVIIPNYNYEKFIVEALNSIKSQTIKYLDLVIVDDYSNDDSINIIKRWINYNFKRFNNILILKHKKNYGVTYTRNTAFENVNTELVFMLDPDNILYPDCIEILLNALRNSDASFSYPLIQKFGVDDNVLNAHKWDVNQLLKDNYIDNMVLIRKSIWNQVGGYSNDMPVFGWEDYDLWLKIAINGGWGLQVTKILAKYRTHMKSLTFSETQYYIDDLRKYIKNKFNKLFDDAENQYKNNYQEFAYKRKYIDVIRKLDIARNTKAWRLMLIFHRIYNELFSKFNFNFVKWITLSLISNKIPDKLKLYNYDPINHYPTEEDKYDVSIYVSKYGNLFFEEIANILLLGFRKIGFKTQIINENDSINKKTDLHIFIAIHELFYINPNGKKLIENIPENSIVINFEQIHTQFFHRVEKYLYLFKTVWDINYQNVLNLRNKGFNAKYLKIGYIEGDENYKEQKKLSDNYFTASISEKIKSQSYLNVEYKKRPIDILFIGGATKKRKEFFAENAKYFSEKNTYLHLNESIMKYPVNNYNNDGIDSKTSIGLAQRSKILLNIHRDIQHFFEWHRIVMHGIWNRTLVITEKSHNPNSFISGKHYVEGKLYEIPDLIEYYLNDKKGIKEAQIIIDNAYEYLTNSCLLKDNLIELLENFNND